MAVWNRPQPLKINRTKKVGSLTMSEIHDLHMGETIPDELMTPAFVGGSYDCLTALSEDDQAKFAAWKRLNPHQANRWLHIERQGALQAAPGTPMSQLEIDAQRLRQ